MLSHSVHRTHLQAAEYPSPVRRLLSLPGADSYNNSAASYINACSRCKILCRSIKFVGEFVLPIY